MTRLYEVEVKATLYVFAESAREAERIACDTDRDWPLRWAFRLPAEASRIDHDWRDVSPLTARGCDEKRTCVEIAEAEALAREVAARQVPLPGVEP